MVNHKIIQVVISIMLFDFIVRLYTAPIKCHECSSAFLFHMTIIFVP